ncbi:hypothetical protein ACFQ05_15055 [Amycolatopsis umgeniensis]|uniref:Uncharacterized protein n=1 Tax=Amycolatopsis umgeniensis TaxID=336628 RepID=A0A841B741_9PSEU|nr:hypothetical protein [Amycolatopsis umgeniensis]
MSDSKAGETDDERRKRGRAPDPLLPGQEPVKPAVPKPVALSFWLWIATGVFLLAGPVYLLIGRQSVIDEFTKQNAEQRDPALKVDPARIVDGVDGLILNLFVGAITFALLFALFAYKAREGTRSARTVLTVLAVVLALIGLFYLAGAIFVVIGTLLAVIALILMYLPSVADYYPKVGRKLP